MTQAYRRTLDNLHLTCVDQKHHDRCSYWFLVSAGSMSHKAFRTIEALEQWLEKLNLKLEHPLVDYQYGDIRSIRIVGTYRTALHRSYDEFYSLEGPRIREVDNGDYTLGIISTEDDGLRTINVLNPNNHDRPMFRYRESQVLIDSGQNFEPQRTALTKQFNTEY